MRDHYDRAAFVAEPWQEVPHKGAASGIESGGRLVKQQQFRLVQYTEGEVKSLAQTARERRDEARQMLREAEGFGQCRNQCVTRRARQAVEGGEEAECFPSGHLRIQLDGL